MNLRRVFALARRVMRQISRDRRTVGLLVFAPMLVLTLAAILFRADPAAIPLGVVDEDEGLSIPLVGKISMGQRIADELVASDIFDVVSLRRDEIDDRLRDDTIQGVVVFPPDFSAEFHQNRQAVLDLRLEGSNPTRSMVITARLTEASMKTLAGLVSMGIGLSGAPKASEEETKLPVTVETTYLFAGEEFVSIL